MSWKCLSKNTKGIHSKEPPYAERHVRWCERSENESRKKTTSFSSYSILYVGGLINSNKLYPFQYKGNISISSYDSPTELDKITEMGIWGIVPTSGAWSTLLVFKSFGGSGGDIQLLFKYNGDVQSRIRTSNSDYTWSSFVKLNN